MGAGAFTHRSGWDESHPPHCAKIRPLGQAEVRIFSGGGGKCRAPRGVTAGSCVEKFRAANVLS